jgi:hypothetical protein
MLYWHSFVHVLLVLHFRRSGCVFRSQKGSWVQVVMGGAVSMLAVFKLPSWEGWFATCVAALKSREVQLSRQELHPVLCQRGRMASCNWQVWSPQSNRVTGTAADCIQCIRCMSDM